MAPTPLARRRSAGVALAVILGAHHLLLLAMFPVVPTNDAVGYVALGHSPASIRPYDPYAPITSIPATTSLPDVPAWRTHQYPAYGYPWVYLDLPPGWEGDPAWVWRQSAAPLATGALAASSLETDVVSMPGFPLWIDLVHALFPTTARLEGLVVFNHLFVVLTGLLLWRIGIALEAPGVGWTAGLLYGLWLLPGARAQEIVGEPLFTVLTVAACWVAIRAWRTTAVRWFAAAGLVVGLAFAVRGVAAPAALALIVAALCPRGPARARCQRAGAAALAFAGVCGLVLLHNGASYGRWTYSTGSGRHLYQRISTVEQRLVPENPSARELLDLAARPRVEGDRPHPLQAGALDPWAESTIWSLYFMLRSRGLSIAQADAVLSDAAWATVRARPAAFGLRSLRNLYRLMRRSDRPANELLAGGQEWHRYVTAWLTPYTHVAPYVWLQAQWRAYRGEFPLPQPPHLVPEGMRQRWLAVAARIPRADGPRALLGLAGVALALVSPRARARGWPLLGAFWVGVLLMPAFGQMPVARYGEPGIPFALLLACFTVAVAAGALRQRGRV